MQVVYLRICAIDMVQNVLELLHFHQQVAGRRLRVVGHVCTSRG